VGELGRAFAHGEETAEALGGKRNSLNIGFLPVEMRARRKTGNKISLEDRQKLVGKPRAIGHLKKNMDRIQNQ
jgi:hypothetical protein